MDIQSIKMSDVNIPELLKRIDQKLVEIGMGKEEFYKLSGISSASYSQWNTGTYRPSKKKIIKAAEILGVTSEYLLFGEDDDSRALEKAKLELSNFIANNPESTSGQRLEILFNASGYDHVVVCFNLGIDQHYLNIWMDDNELPPNPIIDKILGVFRIKPEDLFESNELLQYKRQAINGDSVCINTKSSTSNDVELISTQNNINSSNYNIVKFAARNGKFQEKRLSDEDLAVITRIIDSLPDASDDL